MSKAQPKEREPVALLPAPSHPTEENTNPERRGAPKLVIAIVLLVAAGLIGFGVWRHWSLNQQAAQTQQQQNDFVPTVRTAEAKREETPMKLVLPAQTEAFQTATIYARATGYVAERKVDIGSRVKKGDLLLRISAPDLDQQLAQAQAQVEQTRAAIDQALAQVAQAEANLALQRTNLERSNTLAKQGFETVQNQQTQQTTVESQQAALVTAQAGIKVSQANLKAQQAAVDRLKALTSFEQVLAPFDGVVTARSVEVGDLVNADQGSGTALFRVDEEDVLRVAVSIPQYSSDGVKDGLPAKVTAPQTPGRVFDGKVSRTSVALLYSSRTLTAEVDISNTDQVLSPGQYVDVEIDIPRTTPNVMVPSEALVFDQRGAMVAVVGAESKVKMQKIDIYRDLGTSLELKGGLQGGEKVVLDAPVDLADGAKVKIAPPPQKGGKAQAGNGS